MTNNIDKMHYEFKKNYDFEIYGHKIIKGENIISNYVYHEIDVWRDLKINNYDFTVFYQPGCEYYGNNLHLPARELYIASTDAGTPAFIVELSQLDDEDFDEHNHDNLEEILNTLKTDYNIEATPNELWQLWDDLRNSVPDIDEVMHNYSDDIDDYELINEFGYYEYVKPKKGDR